MKQDQIARAVKGVIGDARANDGVKGRGMGLWGGGAQQEGMVQDLSGKARQTAEQARRTARQAGSSLRARASEADGYIRHTIEGRPITATAVALGVGFLLGRMHRRH